ncbi:putative kinase D-interacting substrate of kDa [Leptodontidium sp. MPI-SDFR-AT-0119]|nr:putative kinase D-interacting substrate of kDa [Leptodontidium sp. MPI-SDFR-AT-0119]
MSSLDSEYNKLLELAAQRSKLGSEGRPAPRLESIRKSARTHDLSERLKGQPTHSTGRLEERVFIQVQWKPFEDHFGGIEARVKRNLQNVHLAAQADALGNQKKTLQKLEDLLKTVTDRNAIEERRQFLEWVSDINPEESHDRIIEKTHPGTTKWLTQREKFQDWFTSLDSSTLWCHGKPGMGKSVLAANVIDYISTHYALSDDVGIAFAYCNFADPKTQEPKQLISTFIKQLCWKRNQLSESLLGFYQGYHGEARIPNLDTCKEQFWKLGELFKEVYIIIDGLDECQEDARGQTLKFLLDPSQGTEKDDRGVKNGNMKSRLEGEDSKVTPRVVLKAIVISRNEADIAKKFQDHAASTLRIDNKDVTPDIAAFIYNQTLKSKVVGKLIAEADGMFLWPKLQLETICREKTERDVEEALGNLPQDLKDTYSRMLHRINSQTTKLKALAHRCFRFADILDACGNFFVVEQLSSVVRPIHVSIWSFLEGHFRDMGGRYVLDRTVSQKELAIACNFDYHIAQIPEIDIYLVRFFNKLLAGPERLGDDGPDFDQAGRANRSVAAILQIRLLRNPFNPLEIRDGFDKNVYPVNPATMLYATRLRDMLLHNKADPNLPGGPLGSAVVAACNSGKVETIRLLLSHNAAIENIPKARFSALHEAVLSGQVSIVDLLLNNGADVNEAFKEMTALLVAIETQKEDITRLLIDRGADVNASHPTKGTALHIAIEKSRQVRGEAELAQLLLRNGANIHRTTKWRPVLHAAVEVGSEKLVQLLLRYDADINEAAGDGATVLSIAGKEGLKEIGQLLIENGANLKAQGTTALEWAAWRAHAEMVRWLLDNGVDVNEGRALQLAATFVVGEDIGDTQSRSKTRVEKTIELLLDRGSNHGAEALRFASTMGNKRIVELLKARGFEEDFEAEEFDPEDGCAGEGENSGF